MRELPRRVFAAGTWLVGLSIILQVLLAGLGVFANSRYFFWHSVVNASVVFFLPLLLILAGWIGRVPGGLLRLAAAVPGLTILQSLLLVPYRMQAPGILRAVSGLHVVNALLIFWIALELVEKTRSWSTIPVAAQSAAIPAYPPGGESDR